LAHGTSDDNVHFQNTIQMIDALVKAGKQFNLMLYSQQNPRRQRPAAQAHLLHAN